MEPAWHAVTGYLREGKWQPRQWQRSRHLQRFSPWHNRYKNLSERTLCPPSPGPDSHISFTFRREVPAWKLKMEHGTAVLNQSEPRGVPLITFPGKEGKAPQPPYFGLFPAASSKQDECNPRCLAAHVPSFPLLSPSPGLCFHLPMDALETQLPSQAVSRCASQDLELCWCCPWAGPSGAASVTRGCLQNKELLHRHVSNSVL